MADGYRIRGPHGVADVHRNWNLHSCGASMHGMTAMWGKWCGLGAVEQITEALTPQFFADEGATIRPLAAQQEETQREEGLRAKFEARPINGNIESRPDELLRNTDGGGDEEDGRGQGRRFQALWTRAGKASRRQGRATLDPACEAWVDRRRAQVDR